MADVSAYPRPSGALTAPLPDACGKIVMNHGGNSLGTSAAPVFESL